MTDTNKNKELQNACIQLGVLSTVGFGLQAYWRCESARLGDNSGTLLLSQSIFFNLKVTPMNIGIVFIFIFFIISLLLYPILSHFCYKIVERNISKKDPTERIVFVYRPLAFMATVFHGVFGYFLGCYIIPFLFFPKIAHIDMVTQENLFLYVFLSFVILLFALAFQYNTIILTNKQIINSFLFFPPWTKNMLLSDLKLVQQVENTLLITSKTGDRISLYAWRKKKVSIFEQRLRDLLQTTRRIIDECRN